MKKILLAFFAACLSAGSLAAQPSVPPSSTAPVSGIPPDTSPEAPLYLVAEPLVDLRGEPQAVPSTAPLKSPYEADPLQETQLLFGEAVKVFEERGEWVRVGAVEQPEFTHRQAWEGYPGWVPRGSLYPKGVHYAPNAVVSVLYARLHDEPSKRSPFTEIPFGSRVSASTEDPRWARVQRPGQSDGWITRRDLRTFRSFSKDPAALRRSILEAARLFLNQPYFWGGRSSHRPDWTDRLTGVDCSGLVNLAYRVNGVDVPRDAHEQRLVSRPLTWNELKPADLIFLAKTHDPQRIVHVLLFVEGDQVLEAVQEFNTVRLTTVRKKLGVPLHDIRPGEPAGDRFVYFGRLLPD
jgi:hypothetical protein